MAGLSIHSPPLNQILSGSGIWEGLCSAWLSVWNPILPKHWSRIETLPQAGRGADQGLLLCALGPPGGCLQLLVCVVKRGSVPAFLKLWFRSHDNSCCQPFPKGLANVKEQKGNKYREHSIKRHVYKDKVCGSDVTCLTRAPGLNSHSFIQ